jgi:hypothetical protein
MYGYNTKKVMELSDGKWFREGIVLHTHKPEALIIEVEDGKIETETESIIRSPNKEKKRTQIARGCCFIEQMQQILNLKPSCK